MLRRAPIIRARDGTFKLRLSSEEREVLRSLPAQLRGFLGRDDPTVRRLFPPAYVDDPDHEAEYRRLMREELINRRMESLAVLDATVDADRLDEAQATAWLKVLNDLRLVLGTTLDVQEDDDPNDQFDANDPRAPMQALYWFLQYLLENLVQALSASL